jgi:hypothetical protein
MTVDFTAIAIPGLGGSAQRLSQTARIAVDQ